MTETLDPRPLYSGALDWAHGLMRAADRPDALDRPTPCAGYDVRTLLGHLVATVRRARVIGEGGDPAVEPVVVSGVADGGYAEAYAAAVDELWPVWRGDDALDRTVVAPWGTTPGRAAVWGYLNETLVHGWDLAVATGQDPEADPGLAGPALAAARQTIPEEPRGGPVPFGPVVASRPGAGPTEQLANWSGHA